MSWLHTPTTDIVIISERGGQEPIRSFLRQLQQIRYEAHVIRHATYEQTSRVPPPRAVLIDAMSRDMQSNGSMMTRIRSAWEYVPIILFARGDEIERISFMPEVQGFLTLPITLPELEARLRFAMTNYHTPMPSPRDQLEYSGIRINLSTYEVWVGGRKVELTYKEFTLLKFFITHPRRAFSRPELLETVWENDYYGGTRTVDVHVRRLRSKLGPQAENLIHTIRNVGYRFG